MFILKAKKTMYKRIFMIFILMIISILAIALYNINNKKSNLDIHTNIEQNIKYYNDNVLTNINEFDNCFADRYVIINSNGLSIGKSKNELENNYYDINIIIEERQIAIYINKLFKEFDRNILCDEIYVAKITDYILKIFNLNIDKNVFCQLIITEYELIRDIDRNSVDSVDKEVVINDINISITVNDNILVMKMGDK